MLKWILAFAIGVSSLLLIPSLLPLYSLLILALVASAIVYLAKTTYFKSQTLKTCLSLISAALFGLVYSQAHIMLRYADAIKAPLNQMEHIIEAQISSIPAVYADYSEFFVTVSNSNQSQLLDKKLKLKWYRSQQVPALGELWQFTIKLKPIQAAINQAGYDFERSMFIQKVEAVGYIKGQAQKIKPATSLSLSAIRNLLYQELMLFNNAGIFQALVLGEKKNISKKQRKTITQYGLNHLFAISGLHIAILAGFGLLLGRLSWGFIPILRNKTSPLNAGLILSCLIALLYASLAGFSLPTQRATIMWLAFALSQLLSRSLKTEQSLALALLIVLLLSPLSVLSASFWMTFIAVLVICLLLVGRVGNKHWFLSLLQLQLALSLSLGLLALIWFQQASLASFIVNILAIPIFSFLLLPAVFVGLILNLIFKQNFLLSILDTIFTSLIHYGSELSNKIPYLTSSFSTEPVLFLLLVIVSIVIWLPLDKFKYPLIATVLIISFGLFSPKDKSEVKMEVFDVGHGLSVVFHTNQEAILYDTGFGSSSVSAAEMYILPTLKKLGIDKLDMLFVSHSDNDHAGGVQALIDNIAIDTIVAGDWLFNKKGIHFDKIKLELCVQNKRWQLSEFNLEVLYPASQTKSFSSNNNSSCVLKVSYKSRSVLLAGDIEKDAEFAIASDSSISAKLSSSILLAPHHGSKTSSSYPFIKMVAPSTVVYSTDRYNRYKMPHPNIKKRYQDFAIKELQTGCTGQISYNFKLDRWQFMRQDRKLWRKTICQ